MALRCARELGARSVTAIDINPRGNWNGESARRNAPTCNSREMTADDIRPRCPTFQFDQLVLEGEVPRPSRWLSISPGRALSWRWWGTLHHDVT
ncbi:hypothetical protein KCP76_06430 [Salmonella enterica subsp. enterica serovar Weltevreden]|nr:hypothetical protein KCP76_06430 [Salmonella enterica subsp. enterica serovar Weltevreden]